LETIKKHSDSLSSGNFDVSMEPASTENDFRDESQLSKKPTFTKQAFGDYFQQETTRSENSQTQSTGFHMAGTEASYLREGALSLSNTPVHFHPLQRNCLLIFDDLFANSTSKVSFMIRGETLNKCLFKRVRG
jgi:hypothetical protein